MPAATARRPKPAQSLATQSLPTHSLMVRVTHWVGAAAMITMILSGWQIYNASPILPFTFPAWATLGGWLGAGIAWHIAAMWLLFADGLLYLVGGLASGHFSRDFWPITWRGLRTDLVAALTFKLKHESTDYNFVQRLMYAGVLVVALLAVGTGLSIWKPVQLGWLTAAFGGYDIARRIHFAMMALIVGFLAVHLTLVALVPSTLVSMVTGGRRQEGAKP